MKLSIIIPIFNKWNFTKSCLKDLAQLLKGHEILIIDNASTDETNSEIDKLSNELFQANPTGFNMALKRNEENMFHSKACNQGFKVALGEYILFLNNDIRVRANHSTWTQDLIKACETTNGLVGPTMGLLDKNFNFVKEANQQLEGNSYIGGWCIAAKTSVWNSLALDNGQIWNEEFPMYFNDVDLSFRAKQRKIPLTCVPLPDVVHFGKISASQINVPKLYNDGRNVFLKHWSK